MNGLTYLALSLLIAVSEGQYMGPFPRFNFSPRIMPRRIRVRPPPIPIVTTRYRTFPAPAAPVPVVVTRPAAPGIPTARRVAIPVTREAHISAPRVIQSTMSRPAPPAIQVVQRPHRTMSRPAPPAIQVVQRPQRTVRNRNNNNWGQGLFGGLGGLLGQTNSRNNLWGGASNTGWGSGWGGWSAPARVSAGLGFMNDGWDTASDIVDSRYDTYSDRFDTYGDYASDVYDTVSDRYEYS